MNEYFFQCNLQIRKGRFWEAHKSKGPSTAFWLSVDEKGEKYSHNSKCAYYSVVNCLKRFGKHRNS